MPKQRQPQRNQAKSRPSVTSRLLSRIGDGLAMLKDFGSNPFGVTWDGAYGWRNIGGGWSTRFPNSDLNWEAEAGVLWLNSVTSICMQYVFDKLIEPRVHVVYEDGQGMLQPVPKHPATALLLNPNPEYRGNALLSGLALSYKLDGNAYALKVRGSGDRGAPTELWYIPHWQMWPLPPTDGGPTEWYVYMRPTQNGVPDPKLIPRRNVIHIKNGLDPNNWRVGLSPARAQLRAYVSDNEIDACTALILRNKGIVGTVISPSAIDVEITTDQAEELKRRIMEQSSGDARGGMLALNLPVKVDQLSNTPQDMALTTIGDRPTARICAAFGIDPATVGLANTSTSNGGGEKYGSMRKESRESSYEQCMMPMLAAFAEAWTFDLLPDFGTNNAGFWIEYDYSRVRDLQENQDALYKRSVEAFKGNVITLDESREMIGRKPHPKKEVGEKLAFELLPPPSGILGVLDPAQANEEAGQIPQAADPDDADLPEEEDENE